MEKIIASMQQQFGLDKPLLRAILDYMWQHSCGSISAIRCRQYPTTVTDLIAQSIPWTLGLLVVTTILSFIIGNLLGAIAAWPRAPRWMRAIATPFMLLTGVPPVLMGVLLLFFVGFRLKLLPLGGAYSIGVIPNWSWAFALDMAKHQILPALALILGIGRRLGAVDARHGRHHPGRGLRQLRRAQGAHRRAHLPRLLPEECAAAAGDRASLWRLARSLPPRSCVEGIFGLPGIGTTLNIAIRSNDFPVIYGIVLFITIAVATLMVLMEFIYPLLDPRIRSQ